SAERKMTGARTRCVEESAASAAGAIYDRFRQLLHVVGVVGASVATVVDESRPAASNSDNPISFAQCANGDCSDRRVQSGDVAAAGEDRDRFVIARHGRKASAFLAVSL